MWHRSVDRILERVKWPVAILSMIWLPFVIWACLQLFVRILGAPFATVAFAFGIALFLAGWKLYLRFKMIGLWLMRAEHEATHLLFAILTMHPIVGLSREARHGSHVRFLGSGNWLIQISPYFFPTAAVVLGLFAGLVPLGGFFFVTSIALGFATGFHVVSTIREIKRDQAELTALSWKFCWMFLPTANLMMLGCMLAMSQNGWSGLMQFTGDLFGPFQILWRLGFPNPSPAVSVS